MKNDTQQHEPTLPDNEATRTLDRAGFSDGDEGARDDGEGARDADSGRGVGGRNPERVGNYVLGREIGSGGMGTVHLAEQFEPIRRRVAVKLIKSGMDTREVIARFEAERQVLALMDHPCIARILDAGVTENGQPYFAMEYVEGESIVQFCNHRRLATRARLELFKQVCQAVQHAHDRGVIHRDLKPSNILVRLESGKPFPKVIDFGIARLLPSADKIQAKVTQVGEVVGTPAYMSPEQLSGHKDRISGPTDVYSLGVVLYELLTGLCPFEPGELQGGLHEFRRQVLEVEPAPPSARLAHLKGDTAEFAARHGTSTRSLLRELRGDLDVIALKAIAKDPERRYAGPGELAADVDRYLAGQPVHAKRPTVTYRLQKWMKRRRYALTAVCGMAALIALAGFYRHRTIEADRASRVAAAMMVFHEARLEAHRRPDFALQQLEDLVRNDPANLNAKLERALLLAREHRREEAIGAAQTVLDEHPECGEAHFLLSRLYRTQNEALAAEHQLAGRGRVGAGTYFEALSLAPEESARAVDLLSAILDKDGMHFDARLERAWRYFEQGMYESMLQDAEILTAMKPMASVAWNYKGLALEHLQRLKQAVDAFTKAIQESPAVPGIQLNRALAYLNLANYEKAMEDCNRAAQIDPDFGGVYGVRSMVHWKRGSVDEAERDAERSLSLDPTNGSAMFVRGMILKSRDRFSEAIEAFNIAIADARTEPAPLFVERGDAYRKEGRLSEAIDDYSAALAKRPDYQRALGNRGLVYQLSGDLEASLADFDRLLELDRNSAFGLHYRARVHRLRGEFERAIEDADRAATISPNQPEHVVARGVAYWMAGRWTESLEDLESVADQTTKEHPTIPLWTWALHRRRGETGDHEAAREILDSFVVKATPFQQRLVEFLGGGITEEKLLAEASTEDERQNAWFFLGLRAWVNGQTEEAIKWFDLIVSQAPSKLYEYEIARALLRAPERE